MAFEGNCLQFGYQSGITLMDRKAKGGISVEVFRDRLRLRWRFKGERYTIGLGYPNEPHYRKVAELKAKVIEADILYDRFDPTLAKYKQSQAPELPQPPQLSLRKLWSEYVEYKRPQCKPSTMRSQYKNWTRYIQKFPIDNPYEAVTIRDWILQTIPIDSAKRLLVALNACCNWAVESKTLDRNPFLNMANQIKLPKPQRNHEDSDINPFTTQERDQIIANFKASRYYSFYAPFVEFLFKTGCRPGEALGLQWKHIGRSYKSITFEQVLSHTENGLRLEDGLKTQEKRRFPCNPSETVCK